MSKTTIAPIQNTLRKTDEWLDELNEIGHFTGKQQAYSVLYGVLHTLRDTLPVNEAVQFSAGMPMLVRGLYFEGWNPSKVPITTRDWESLHQRLRENFRGTTVDPLHACRSVFELLRRRIDPGEFQDMFYVLHHSVREMLTPARHPSVVL